MFFQFKRGQLFRGLWRSLEPLQFFAGLEAYGFAWWDVYFFAGTRISTNPGLAWFDAKYTKAAQFDALAAAKGAFQRLENSLDSLLGLGAADVRRSRVHHGVHDVQLDHASLQLLSVGRC
jgi:hypothetical protein